MTEIKLFPSRTGTFEYWRSTDLNRKFPPHFHDYWLAGRLLAGTRRVALSRGDFLLSSNAIFLLNAGEIHACENLEGTAQWECLHFPLACVRQIEPECLKKPFFEHFLLIDNNITEKFSRVAELLRGNITMPMKIATLFGLLASLRASSGKTAGKLELSNPLIDWECLDPACASLAEFARKAAVSKNGFIHMFSRKFGISPHKFIISLRLANARKLLFERNTQAQAALQSGFYDQAHFCKTFRASLGYSPGLYRQAALLNRSNFHE